ncbi:hypothetical protein K1719_015792 [Acacia pycnantha]|nr:hypothetical protein K1719_015792 [Acacia pycnantha]
MNLKRNLGRGREGPWKLIFGAGAWLLWEWRNKLLFENNFSKPHNPALVTSQAWVRYADSASVAGTDLLLRRANGATWQKPQVGWIKLNVDGVMLVALSRLVVGGCLGTAVAPGCWGLC